MRRAKITSAIVAVLLLVILSFQNPQPVVFKFLWIEVPVPKILLMVLSGLVGSLATLIIQYLLRRNSGSPSPSQPSP
jgi:uncharacterized integral membrane protein